MDSHLELILPHNGQLWLDRQAECTREEESAGSESGVLQAQTSSAQCLSSEEEGVQGENHPESDSVYSSSEPIGGGGGDGTQRVCCVLIIIN